MDFLGDDPMVTPARIISKKLHSLGNSQNHTPSRSRMVSKNPHLQVAARTSIDHTFSHRSMANETSSDTSEHEHGSEDENGSDGYLLRYGITSDVFP